MRRAGSLEKTLMLGKTEGRRRSGRQRMRWLAGITDSMDMSLGLLRVPWTTRRSNQSILKKIKSEYSLKGLMLKLKLKLQYFGHLIERANSLEKTLMLGKTEDRRKGT